MLGVRSLGSALRSLIQEAFRADFKASIRTAQEEAGHLHAGTIRDLNATLER